jgi:hypothetical protein
MTLNYELTFKVKYKKKHLYTNVKQNIYLTNYLTHRYHRGRDCMLVRFITTYVISSYHY